MSPRLEVRPSGGTSVPDYPGIAADPAPLASRRYGDSVLERMRRGISRPLVVFGLYASLALPARADDADPRDPPGRDLRAEPTVRMLSREEIAGLVGGLERLQIEVAQEVDGLVAGQMGFLTEEEGRSLLEALFKKNGYAVDRDVRVRGAGIDFAADALDEARKVGFEYLALEESGLDLGPEEISELDLERARGGRAVLVIDGRHYGYNVSYMDQLPSKAQAVDRLLEDVRRFLVWIEKERR